MYLLYICVNKDKISIDSIRFAILLNYALGYLLSILIALTDLSVTAIFVNVESPKI